MSYVSEAIKVKFLNIQNEMVNRILNQKFDFIEIGVFGSYAREEYNALSDIDICVIVKDMPSRYVKGWLRDDAEELGADICFITEEQFKSSNTVFMNNLRKDYRRVYYDKSEKSNKSCK